LFVSLDIGDALSLPLYDTSKITYEGAFLVPEGGRDLGGGVIVTGNQYGLQGAGAIAYNPSGDSGNGSLYLSAGLVEGNANEPCLCEISIPVAKTSNYNRASLLQNYELLGGSVGTFPDSGGHSGDNGTAPTGMLYIDGHIYFTAAGIYRNTTQATTLFRGSDTLSSNSIDGPFSVVSASLNQRDMGNGLGCPIPANWQSVFGGATIMGGGGHSLSLLNNANYGPGFWVIDHTDIQGLSDYGNVTGTAILRHPNGSSDGTGYYPYLGDYPSAYFSGMSSHRGTIMLPDSRTVLTYGTWASNSVYDTGGAISGLTQGPIALDGSLVDRFLLFDARDLKDAYDGTVTDEEGIFPYDAHDMDFCISNGTYRPGWRGACWDAENRVCYIGEDDGGGSSYPIIHVLSFGV